MMNTTKHIAFLFATTALLAGCVVPGDWVNDPVSFRGTLMSTNGLPIRDTRIIAVQPYSGIGRQHLRAAKGDYIPEVSPRTEPLTTTTNGDFAGDFTSYLRGGPVWIIPPLSLIWPPRSYVLFGIPEHNRVFAVCYSQTTPTTKGWAITDDGFTRMSTKELRSEFHIEKLVSARDDALNKGRSETLHNLDIQIKK